MHHYLVAYSAAWSACTDQAAYMWKNLHSNYLIHEGFAYEDFLMKALLMKALLMKALLMKATINNMKKTFVWLKKLNSKKLAILTGYLSACFGFRPLYRFSSLFYMPWFCFIGKAHTHVTVLLNLTILKIFIHEKPFQLPTFPSLKKTTILNQP